MTDVPPDPPPDPPPDVQQGPSGGPQPPWPADQVPAVFVNDAYADLPPQFRNKVDGCMTWVGLVDT